MMSSSVASKQVVVVGTGLAGLTTTHQLLKKGVNVVLLEKTGVVGMASNSNKASSGINGALTDQQIVNGIQDSAYEFILDSVQSAKESARVDLINILANRSKLAIDWLTLAFDIDLSKVSQLGGHHKPRTHRGAGSLPPGYAIVSTLSKALDKYEAQNKLQILKNSRLTKLLSDEGKIIGLEYEDGNTDPPTLKKLLTDNIVLATGGFSADFTDKNSLIAQYRPELLDLPSTNGKQTTGDGIKLLCEDVGAAVVDMDKIQIHPTGFVDPLDPDNKWKFLAGEVLRGNGGILLNDRGERFVNELTTRDRVTEAIYETKSKDNHILLVLPESAFEELKGHIGFYMSKGLMSKTTLGELAKDRGFPLENVVSLMENYNAQGKEFKRLSYGDNFETSPESVIYYGIVTPVVHFTMGGLKIDDRTRVLNTENKPIEGLYAVGEVSGGVHGENRLGGSSLLECVVFGTVAAELICHPYTFTL